MDSSGTTTWVALDRVGRSDTHLEALRRRELEALRGWFRPGMKVLELGGQTGFHAAILTSWGCSVTSLDVRQPRDAPRYFPVRTYDGRHLPGEDGSFDAVYSSHMLYHVLDVPELFAEIRRVLKPDGLAIHLMPSASWRVASALGHYPHMIGKVRARLGRARAERSGATRPVAPDGAAADGDPANDAGSSRVRRVLGLARTVLVPHPLGPAPSVVAELRQWQKHSMVRGLRERGFDTIAVVPSRLFYTPYEFLGPHLSRTARSWLSAGLGSSSVAFVTRKRPA